MSKRAFTDIRGIELIVDTGGEKVSPDFYKAVLNKAEQLEDNYLNNPALEDLAEVSTVFTGTSRYRLYSCTLTTVFADGTYTFTYVETVPNAESLS